MSPYPYKRICSNSGTIGIVSVNECPACCQGRAVNAPVPEVVARLASLLVAKTSCCAQFVTTKAISTVAWQSHTPSTAVPLTAGGRPNFVLKLCAHTLSRSRLCPRLLSHEYRLFRRALLSTSASGNRVPLYPNSHFKKESI